MAGHPNRTGGARPQCVTMICNLRHPSDPIVGSFSSTACWRELAAADSSSLIEHAVVRGNGRADHDAERRRRAAKGDGLTILIPGVGDVWPIYPSCAACP